MPFPILLHYSISSCNYLSSTSIFPFQQATNDLGFSHPTPIQASTIPVALLGKDICACAATGTGEYPSKLVGFCILSWLGNPFKWYGKVRHWNTNPTQLILSETPICFQYIVHMRYAPNIHVVENLAASESFVCLFWIDEIISCQVLYQCDVKRWSFFLARTTSKLQWSFAQHFMFHGSQMLFITLSSHTPSYDGVQFNPQTWPAPIFIGFIQ